MGDATIQKSIFLAAPKQTVWEFLTDKDKLGSWFFTADANLAQGRSYELSQKDDDGSPKKMCWGEVLKMDAPNRLEFLFTIAPLGGQMTTVVWELEDAVGGTKLSLTHSGIEGAVGSDGGSVAATLGLIMALDGGWDKHLGALRGALK